MNEIILFGAGGHGRAVLALIQQQGDYKVNKILDDAPVTKILLGVPVEQYNRQSLNGMTGCVAIGDNASRKKVADSLRCEFPVLAHSSSVIYTSVRVGAGCQILPNAVLDVEVTLGRFNIINNNATVSHNVTTGDYVHIAINAAVSGGVHIGEGTLVGAGSVVLPGVSIGKWATIGAGAVVKEDVPDHAVVVGNPGKIIRYNQL